MIRWVDKLQPLDKSHETFIFQICDDERKHYLFAKASFQDKKVTIKDSLRGSRNENDPFYIKIFQFISSVIRCVYPTQVQHEWGREVCKGTIQQIADKNACAAAFLTIAYDEVTGDVTEDPESYEDMRNILFSIMMKRIHDHEMEMERHKVMQPLQFIGSAAGSTYTSELELTYKKAWEESVSDNKLFNTVPFWDLKDSFNSTAMVTCGT